MSLRSTTHLTLHTVTIEQHKLKRVSQRLRTGFVAAEKIAGEDIKSRSLSCFYDFTTGAATSVELSF